MSSVTSSACSAPTNPNAGLTLANRPVWPSNQVPLRDLLKPQGVAVVVEAMHLCSMMRGVKKHDARMTTSAMHGAFRANLATRQEFLANISRGATPLQI